MFISDSQADTIVLSWMPWTEMNRDILKSDSKLPTTVRKMAWHRSSSPNTSASVPDICLRWRHQASSSLSLWKRCLRWQIPFRSRPASYLRRIKPFFPPNRTKQQCSAPILSSDRIGALCTLTLFNPWGLVTSAPKRRDCTKLFCFREICPVFAAAASSGQQTRTGERLGFTSREGSIEKR